MELVVLVSYSVSSSARSHLVGGLEHRREVELPGLGGSKSFLDLEDFGVSDHLVDGLGESKRSVSNASLEAENQKKSFKRRDSP